MLDLRTAPGLTSTAKRAPSLDSVSRGEPDVPLPCVLLVSRAADREFALVSRLLARIGIPAARLNAETAARHGLLADLDQGAVRIGGRWINPTVTWVRHFSPQAMPARRTALPTAFAADSWLALAGQLGSLSAELIPGTGLELIDQLAAARAAGIAVPRTVVSTDPIAAARLIGGQKVIIKALHQHFVEAKPGLLSGVFPEIVEAGSIARSGRPRGIPVVVQEYLAHQAEIRCYYVGGDIATFSVDKSNPAEPWLNPKAVKAEQVDPPPTIAAAASALASVLSVRYGAFDFLLADGKPIFLELNWAGDWRWIETRARVGSVTTAVTSMLRDLHLKTARNSFSAHSANQARRNHFDLIGFLSGGHAETS
ncbi:MAG TPA: hypothetical protein VN767_04370 [Streptosporangiaceae bacterium]|nr:hypothetical protein [Streptosporangiaceae bacterium]